MASGAIAAGLPAHELAYRELKQRILYGEFKPGRPVTLQGIADELGVGLTPIRESVRRLIAERALEFHGNRRISLPQMTHARLEEIYTVRSKLEPELACRAAAHITKADIDHLEAIDGELDRAIAFGDVGAYLKHNFRFHRALYAPANSQVLLPIVESLWLQFGPSLRVVCGRYGTSGLSDQHKEIIKALRAANIGAVREAILRDIAQGCTFITDELFANENQP
ncbi:MAG: GntR family transcriptional regulator [Alphaproteobacteria bacterium]|nr:MAG: GntR family transcriptional regulator [Alphaproteobacteria bacterium]